MTEFITHDICYKGQYVKPGSKVKIKGKWGTYIYISVLCLGDIDDSWIICEDSKGERFRFKPGQVKKIINKRSFWKNV